MLKVLIISHNPLCTYNNMGKTLLSLFSEFDKNELCQLYVYPSVPDVEQCASFYRITDMDVVKSFINFFCVNGTEQIPVCSQHDLLENCKDEKIYANSKYKTTFAYLLRDAVWEISRWFNKELCKWIEEQEPTCIFLAPGKSKFIYSIATKIAQRYHLPIVTYFADDYYFVKKPECLLARIQTKLLKARIERIISMSSYVITISEEMRICYKEQFDVPVTIIMTGAGIPIAEKPYVVEHPTTITYMGNLQCNRYRSLVDIGEALDAINLERNTNYRLRIYTGEKDTYILSCFDDIRSVELCGYVSGETYRQVFGATEMFLHVEAFDEESINLVKKSISTKIADCLASGKPLIAYGPSLIASITYLESNGAAVVIKDQRAIKENLWRSMQDIARHNTVAKKGLEVAEANHRKEENSRRVYAICKMV